MFVFITAEFLPKSLFMLNPTSMLELLVHTNFEVVYMLIYTPCSLGEPFGFPDFYYKSFAIGYSER